MWLQRKTEVSKIAGKLYNQVSTLTGTWSRKSKKKSVQSLFSPLSTNAPFVTFFTGQIRSGETARPRTRLTGDREDSSRSDPLPGQSSSLAWHGMLYREEGGGAWWLISCFSSSHSICPRPVCPGVELWATPMQSGTVDISSYHSRL